MTTTKTLSEAQDTTPAAPVVTGPQEAPEKSAGPHQAARIATTAAASSPNGSPSGGPGADLFSHGGGGPRAQRMMTLQRSVGNARVSRMIGKTIQTKMSVSAVDDPQEQEADRTVQTTEKSLPEQAEQKQTEPPENATGLLKLFRALSGSGAPLYPESSADHLSKYSPAGFGSLNRTPMAANNLASLPIQPTLATQPQISGAVQRMCDCPSGDHAGGGCAQCSGKGQAIQRQADDSATESSLPPSVTEVVGSSVGQPLLGSTRRLMEPSLGADLAGARVHTGPEAALAAKDVQARAFTVGQDIYFGEGQYQPDNKQGQHLLAHELTHTVQQATGRAAFQSNSVISRPDEPLEQEAEGVADSVSNVEASRPEKVSRSGHASTPLIQRAWYDIIGKGAGAVWGGVKWAGGKVASGAGAAWKGVKWAGGKVVNEAVRVGGAALECAQAVGASALSLLNFELPSFEDMGFVRPSGDAPVGIMDAVIAILRHPCVRMIPGYPLLANSVGMLQKIYSFLKGAWEIIQNPQIAIDAIREAIGGMVSAIPDQARVFVKKAASVVGASEDHLEGVWRHLEPKLTYLGSHWWEVIKETASDLVWPWPGVAKDFGEIWDHLKAGANDLWDLEINSAIDHFLAVWRTTNTALGRLYGWIFVASVLIGAILGAVFGGGVGAIPGALAGVKFALLVGQALLISTIAAETASIGKAAFDLAQGEQSEEENEEDYDQIANSGLVLGITGAMYVIGVVGARFARGVINRVGKLRLPKIARRVLKLPKQMATVCTIGSLNCIRVPPEFLKAAPYPRLFGIPFPRGPYSIMRSFLAGVSRSSALLRSIAKQNRKAWPHFDKALAKAERLAKAQGLDPALAWPTENGIPWEVHHIQPVSFGGGNAPGNLVPLPKSIHVQYTNWWNTLHRRFKSHFTAQEWDDLMRNVADVDVL